MYSNRTRVYRCLDFESSSIGWKLKSGSFGEFSINASLKEKQTNQIYYLSKTILAGNVYGKSTLPVIPNYNFQWITNGKEQIIYRSFLSDKIKLDYKTSSKVDKYILNISYRKKKQITIDDLITNSKLFRKSIICRMYFKNFISEFPLKHINTMPKNNQFQIETGPILFKDKKTILTAFIFFNSFHKCQIVYNYPKLGGIIKELEARYKFFVNA